MSRLIQEMAKLQVVSACFSTLPFQHLLFIDGTISSGKEKQWTSLLWDYVQGTGSPFF
jgi:hypothetical protein